MFDFGAFKFFLSPMGHDKLSAVCAARGGKYFSHCQHCDEGEQDPKGCLATVGSAEHKHGLVIKENRKIAN